MFQVKFTVINGNRKRERTYILFLTGGAGAGQFFIEGWYRTWGGRIFLDLFNEQVPRKAFAVLSDAPLLPFPSSGIPSDSHSFLCHFTLRSLLLKTIQMSSLVQNAVAQVGIGQPWYTHVTPVHSNMHQLPLCFQAWLKVLVITYIVLHGIEPGYLKEHLIHTASAWFIWSGRWSALQILQLNKIKLWNTISVLPVYQNLYSGMKSPHSKIWRPPTCCCFKATWRFDYSPSPLKPHFWIIHFHLFPSSFVILPF